MPGAVPLPRRCSSISVDTCVMPPTMETSGGGTFPEAVVGPILLPCLSQKMQMGLGAASLAPRETREKEKRDSGFFRESEQSLRKLRVP